MTKRGTAITEPPSAPASAADTIGVRRLLDKEASAAYLSTSIDTIERLIHSGQLAVVRLPAERAKNGRGRVGACRRVLIDIWDLDALIARSKELSR